MAACVCICVRTYAKCTYGSVSKCMRVGQILYIRVFVRSLWYTFVMGLKNWTGIVFILKQTATRKIHGMPMMMTEEGRSVHITSEKLKTNSMVMLNELKKCNWYFEGYITYTATATPPQPSSLPSTNIKNPIIIYVSVLYVFIMHCDPTELCVRHAQKCIRNAYRSERKRECLELIM